MNVDIKSFYYNETKLKDDGITHHIGERKLAFDILLHSIFWDCEDEYTAYLLLIKELKILRKQLESELNQRLVLKRSDLNVK